MSDVIARRRRKQHVTGKIGQPADDDDGMRSSLPPAGAARPDPGFAGRRTGPLDRDALKREREAETKAFLAQQRGGPQREPEPQRQLEREPRRRERPRSPASPRERRPESPASRVRDRELGRRDDREGGRRGRDEQRDLAYELELEREALELARIRLERERLERERLETARTKGRARDIVDDPSPREHAGYRSRDRDVYLGEFVERDREREESYRSEVRRGELCPDEYDDYQRSRSAAPQRSGQREHVRFSDEQEKTRPRSGGQSRRPEPAADPGHDGFFNSFGQEEQRRRRTKETEREAYRRELDEQLATVKIRKESEKMNTDAYQSALEAMDYNPFGKGGAGAPNVTADGRTVTTRTPVRNPVLEQGPSPAALVARVRAQDRPNLQSPTSPSGGMGQGGFPPPGAQYAYEPHAALEMSGGYEIPATPLQPNPRPAQPVSDMASNRARAMGGADIFGGAPQPAQPGLTPGAVQRWGQGDSNMSEREAQRLKKEQYRRELEEQARAKAKEKDEEKERLRLLEEKEEKWAKQKYPSERDPSPAQPVGAQKDDVQIGGAMMGGIQVKAPPPRQDNNDGMFGGGDNQPPPSGQRGGGLADLMGTGQDASKAAADSDYKRALREQMEDQKRRKEAEEAAEKAEEEKERKRLEKDRLEMEARFKSEQGGESAQATPVGKQDGGGGGMKGDVVAIPAGPPPKRPDDDEELGDYERERRRQGKGGNPRSAQKHEEHPPRHSDEDDGVRGRGGSRGESGGGRYPPHVARPHGRDDEDGGYRPRSREDEYYDYSSRGPPPRRQHRRRSPEYDDSYDDRRPRRDHRRDDRYEEDDSYRDDHRHRGMKHDPGVATMLSDLKKELGEDQARMVAQLKKQEDIMSQLHKSTQNSQQQTTEAVRELESLKRVVKDTDHHRAAAEFDALQYGLDTPPPRKDGSLLVQQNSVLRQQAGLDESPDVFSSIRQPPRGRPEQADPLYPNALPESPAVLDSVQGGRGGGELSVMQSLSSSSRFIYPDGAVGAAAPRQPYRMAEPLHQRSPADLGASPQPFDSAGAPAQSLGGRSATSTMASDMDSLNLGAIQARTEQRLGQLDDVGSRPDDAELSRLLKNFIDRGPGGAGDTVGSQDSMGSGPHPFE